MKKQKRSAGDVLSRRRTVSGAIVRGQQDEMNRSRTNVFGLELDCIDQASLITEVLSRVRVRSPGYVIPTNLYHVVKLQRDDGSLHSAFAGAAFVVADGRPLVWMARLRGVMLPLITGSDLLVPLCQAAAREKRSVFFFGTTFDALTECARRLYTSIDGLEISGVYAPPFGFKQDPSERQFAEDAIKAAAPDIVFVALGLPKQEIWARDNAAKLNAQVICVGAAIDFIAGKQRRAPQGIRRVGFEWLWRALTEPRRLFARYTIMLYWLPVLVAKELKSARR
jgi:N-acetylglucosaminyldiphosphoundecaprenol N-acetyl-beta-D-mannosaminyltransferase